MQQIVNNQVFNCHSVAVNCPGHHRVPLELKNDMQLLIMKIILTVSLEFTRRHNGEHEKPYDNR